MTRQSNGFSSELAANCYERALDLLRASARADGFVASSLSSHYDAIWTRDAAISTLGANASGDPQLLRASRRTIETLVRFQSHLGQICNAYWPDRSYWDWGEMGSTDSTAWFVIAAIDYCKASSDDRFLHSTAPYIRRALDWLAYQDSNNMGLITSPEASEWMDSSFNRSGKVLYVNVLYQWALDAAEQIAQEPGLYRDQAAAVRDRIRIYFWPEQQSEYVRLLDHVPYPPTSRREFPHPASLQAYERAIDPQRRYFLSHGTFGQFVDRCDVLGNVLAVLTGVADGDQSRKILDYLHDEKVDDPYPARCWLRPEDGIREPYELFKVEADRNQGARWRNPPHQYHNGAVWPFIGGFYSAALGAAGRLSEASGALDGVAEANRVAEDGEWGFHEWIDARTGEPKGTKGQAWNAGTYVLASRVLQRASPR